MKRYFGINAIISIILIVCFNLTFFKSLSLLSIILTTILGIYLLIFSLCYYTYDKPKKATKIHIVTNILFILISIPQVLTMLLLLTLYILNFSPKKSFEDKLGYEYENVQKNNDEVVDLLDEYSKQFNAKQLMVANNGNYKNENDTEKNVDNEINNYDYRTIQNILKSTRNEREKVLQVLRNNVIGIPKEVHQKYMSEVKDYTKNSLDEHNKYIDVLINSYSVLAYEMIDSQELLDNGSYEEGMHKYYIVLGAVNKISHYKNPNIVSSGFILADYKCLQNFYFNNYYRISLEDKKNIGNSLNKINNNVQNLIKKSILIQWKVNKEMLRNISLNWPMFDYYKTSGYTYEDTNNLLKLYQNTMKYDQYVDLENKIQAKIKKEKKYVINYRGNSLVENMIISYPSEYIADIRTTQNIINYLLNYEKSPDKLPLNEYTNKSLKVEKYSNYLVFKYNDVKGEEIITEIKTR